ncbi:MAG: hypothetical protein J6M62_00905 [Selenomonadaceae bacterium]|nr:hypothetical protein [Selenomonadaceae bacterium]
MKNDKLPLVCIYGMGARGIYLYFSLYEYGINVDYFADKDRRKKENVLGETEFLSYEELSLHKKDMKIIVAIEQYEKLAEEFTKMGFVEVENDVSVLRRLKQIKPAKIPRKIDTLNQILDLKTAVENWAIHSGKIRLDNLYHTLG